VEVLVEPDEVRIFLGSEEVARHRRGREPHSRITDPSHYDGLLRRATATLETPTESEPPSPVGRSLAEYAAVVEGGDQ